MSVPELEIGNIIPNEIPAEETSAGIPDAEMGIMPLSLDENPGDNAKDTSIVGGNNSGGHLPGNRI